MISLTKRLQSQQLTDFIRQKIIDSPDHHISFELYMHLALYTPGLGYYNSDSKLFGKTGDFVTAPEISPLFAQCVAVPCQGILNETSGNILEIGAGSGILAKDLLTQLIKLNSPPKKYFIFELSYSLRERQQQFLQASIPELFPYFEWLDNLPEQFNGMIFANEVLDALPVTCFCFINGKLKERCVTWENNHFAWCLAEPSEQLTLAVEHLSQTINFPDHYCSEINLNLSAWLKEIANCLSHGAVLLFDYGYGRSEYYFPERNMGTLKCFFQHRHHDDPFVYPGLQDITAHVDFTAVAENAVNAGLDFKGYTTQADFLLQCGLLDFANQTEDSEVERYQRNQAIKLLTLPSEMGERIKVISFTKNMEASLQGFALHNRSRDL